MRYFSTTQPFAADTKRLAALILGALFCAVLALAMVPAIASADESSEGSYSWYVEHVSGEYVISSPQDLMAFAQVVNGTADADGDGQTDAAYDFSGEIVVLGGDLNMQNAMLTPIGTPEHPFNGTFNGQGHTIDNFTIVGDADHCQNLGLFGYAGAESLLTDVVIGQNSNLILQLGDESDRTADNEAAIECVGLLVGCTEGDLANIVTNGDVEVSHAANQTKTNIFVIQAVGGIAGSCLGDMTNCSATAKASLTVTETGVPYKGTADETDWDDQARIVVGVGGLVGRFGAIDASMVEIMTGSKDGVVATHGTMQGCSNASTIRVETPQENGLDRFGNQIYAQSSDIGGIAGYSRGSVLGCYNAGDILGAHMNSAGGIVGNLRARTETTSYNGNFSNEDSDDGTVACEADALTITDCYNTGTIYGYAFTAGIAGRAGSYTSIYGCMNGTNGVNRADTRIVATRSTKPFPAGICGSSAGTVAYCGNFGEIWSGVWEDEEYGSVKAKGGYYASGLVGNLVYFTKKNDAGEQERYTPLPEVYACFSAGMVNAIDNMRQRLIVGDSGGYVHNCVGLTGLCWDDRLVYGMYEGDNESSGGSYANLYCVKEATALSNGKVSDDSSVTVLGMLNMLAPSSDFDYYWVISDANDGMPMLNTFASPENPADITDAEVSLASNALYNGGAAIPQVKVTLNGSKLIQDVDYRVIPDSDQFTAINEDPAAAGYTATVVGIGNYAGTAAQKVSYGISRGDLSTCSVVIDAVVFNWEAQAPTYASIHLTDSAGNPVESSADEFTFAFDPEGEKLTDGEAINSGHYPIILTATDSADSHFTGTVTGDFSIRTAKIGVDVDPDEQEKLAKPQGLSYLGQTYEWESQTVLSSIAGAEPEMRVAYTGKCVKPTVTGVTYKGRELVEGRDYRVVYGTNETMDGAAQEPGTENLGVEGELSYGYVTVRYISGSNFSNYDIMKFIIDDRPASEGGLHEDTHDLSKAEVKAIDDIIFEEGDPYEPVVVTYGGSELTKGTDYTITYKNNDAVGTASYTIVGKGSYTGTLTGTFEIVEGHPYDFTWEYDDEALMATVTGFEYLGVRDSFDLVIPSAVKHDGRVYTVTAIGDSAFGSNSSLNLTDDMKKIRSVTIPPSVQVIGENAFNNGNNATDWSQLSQVIFQDVEESQLTTIGASAFYGCGNLTSFTFPAKVTTIGKSAFRTGSKTKPSSLTKLIFLAQDPTLPSDVSDSYTFMGLGMGTDKVMVYGYETATAVKTLAESNAIPVSDGNKANYGHNFVFAPIQEYYDSLIPTLPISFTKTSVSKTYGNAAFSSPSLKDVAGRTVTYKSSNTKVATVSSAGKVTIKGAGSATITASAAGNGEYKAASASYKLTVAKASQTIKASKGTSKTKTYKAAKSGSKKGKLKSTKSFSAKSLFGVTGNKGTLKFSKVSGNSKITVSSSGAVKVKSGLKKGTYKVKIRAAAKEATNYKATSGKVVTLKVVVK